jgi:tagatose 1,6-diphosphate aldolase GatY/KbaY
MSLGVGLELLRQAQLRHRAIVAAVVYDLAGLAAVVDAGSRTRQPMIAQVGSPAFAHVDRQALIPAAFSAASTAPEPVGIHLDHARDLDEIRACLDAGYSSVMIDGSRLGLVDNIELTRRAVEIARPYGAWVEGELGHLAGDENRSSDAAAGSMTDPTEVARFVDESGVDVLAVCVGNVHGRTSTPVDLDVVLLSEIASATPVPLVLHGASGLAPDTLAATLQLGVAKINVNADLRAAALDAIAAHRAVDHAGDDLPGALTAARTAMTDRLVGLTTFCTGLSS